MPEPFTLIQLLLAGARIVGEEAIKEGTKDAYRKLKEKVGELFGSRAVKVVAKLEDESTQEQGSDELKRYLGEKFDPEEAAQIQPLVDEFVRALRADPAANKIAHARVGLNIEAGGNALIRDIQDAREIAAKVKAGGDVTVDGLRMDTGRFPGK